MRFGLNEYAWHIAVFAVPEGVLRDQNVESASLCPFQRMLAENRVTLVNVIRFRGSTCQKNLVLGAMANSSVYELRRK